YCACNAVRVASGVVVLTWPYTLSGDMPKAASAEPFVTSEFAVPVEPAIVSARAPPLFDTETPAPPRADCSLASVDTWPGPVPNWTFTVPPPLACTLSVVPDRPATACSRLVDVPVAPATPNVVAADEPSTSKLTSVLFDVSCRNFPVPSSEAVTAPFGPRPGV